MASGHSSMTGIASGIASGGGASFTSQSVELVSKLREEVTWVHAQLSEQRQRKYRDVAAGIFEKLACIFDFCRFSRDIY